MKKTIVLAMLFSLLTLTVFATVIIREDFTSANYGALPATLDAQWDAGVDVKVYTRAELGVPVEHPLGADGYVLGVGDLGEGGYNFCFSATYTTDAYTDGVVEAWAYFDFEGISLERDYGVFIRATADPAGGVYPLRSAYWFFVTANSSWGTYVPTNGHAFILKRPAGAWVQVGTEGTGTYTTGWHKLRLEVTGTSIKGYVDGVLEVSATDSGHTQGTAGMVFYDDNDVNKAGAFDNFYWDDNPLSGIEIWHMY